MSQNLEQLNKYFERVTDYFGKPNDDPKEFRLKIDLVKTDNFRQCVIDLLLNAHLLDFEQRKDSYMLLKNALKVTEKIQDKEVSPMLNSVLQRSDKIIQYLMEQFSNKEMSSFVGNTLRILIKSEFIEKLLNMEFIKSIVEISKSLNFDIASEAQEVFHLFFHLRREELVRKVCDFIADNFDEFFENYNKIIYIDNYLAKRDFLKTLYTLLMDPRNETLLIRYLSEKKYLVQVLHLLSDVNAHIQKEGFSIFQLYLQNLDKIQQPEIRKLIQKNKQNILQILHDFKLPADSIDQENQPVDKDDFSKECLLHYIEDLPNYQHHQHLQ